MRRGDLHHPPFFSSFFLFFFTMCCGKCLRSARTLGCSCLQCRCCIRIGTHSFAPLRASHSPPRRSGSGLAAKVDYCKARVASRRSNLPPSVTQSSINPTPSFLFGRTVARRLTRSRDCDCVALSPRRRRRHRRSRRRRRLCHRRDVPGGAWTIGHHLEGGGPPGHLAPHPIRTTVLRPVGPNHPAYQLSSCPAPPPH